MLHDQLVGTPFELEFDASPAAASTVRQAARSYLDDEQISADVATDVELVVSELASNAVEQQPAEFIRLAVAIGTEGVSVMVSNVATSNPPVEQGRFLGAATDAGSKERGWGLEIVAALTDSFRCEQAEGWTSMVCFRRFDRSSA